MEVALFKLKGKDSLVCLALKQITHFLLLPLEGYPNNSLTLHHENDGPNDSATNH